MVGMARWDAGEDRGQTAFDFLAGMTVFLVAIGFVFSFVPGMFQPFDTDTGASMVAADRGAALLVEGVLVNDVTEPSVLNETCTAEFFDPADGPVSGCRFGEDASNVNEALGLVDYRTVNVTIESDDTVLELDAGGSPITLAAGRAPPSTADVVVAKRVVLVDGDQGTLFVRVW